MFWRYLLPVVLEIKKDTLSLAGNSVSYSWSFCYFIDDFILLINELPIQHRILIVGDFNLDLMLPENVVKVDPLIHNCNLSQRSQYYWILYLILQIPVLLLLYHHPTVITFFLFSKSVHYIYIEFSFQQYSFQSSLHNS